METETNPYVPLTPEGLIFSKVKAFGAGCIVQDATDGEMVIMDRAELQALVQWAYDAHGILAAPSYDTEAERAPELDPLQMIHDHVNKAHAQQAENRSGARALGYAAVHGVDL